MLSALSLLPLLAFVRVHIHSIDHNTLVVLFDNRTQHAATAIAATLHAASTAVTTINYSTWHDRVDVLASSRKLLLITLLSHYDENSVAIWHIIKLKFQNKCIIVGDPESMPLRSQQGFLTQSKVFYVTLRTDGLTFMAWHIESTPYPPMLLVHFNNTTSFLASGYWLAFIGQLRRLPAMTDVVIPTNNLNPLKQSFVSFNGRMFLTGIDVGINRLVAERVGVRKFHHVGGSLEQQVNKVYANVRHMDGRISVEATPAPRNRSGCIWLRSDRIVGDVLQLDRYVVLVPRLLYQINVVPQSYQIERTIVLFVAVVLLVSTVRWIIRRRLNYASSRGIADLLLDTYGRLLSNAPAMVNDMAAAERWLLAVVGVVAIVFGTLCSGSLYERWLLGDEKSLHKTVVEMCTNHELIHFWERIEVISSVKSCHLWVAKPHAFTRNQSIIAEEDTAQILARLGHHYKSLQPFGNIAKPSWSSNHWFLEHPVRVVLRRCFEHGFHQALRAAANHSMMLKQTADPDIRKEATVDYQFSVAQTVGGWLVSGVVFAAELLIHHRLRMGNTLKDWAVQCVWLARIAWMAIRSAMVKLVARMAHTRFPDV